MALEHVPHPPPLLRPPRGVTSECWGVLLFPTPGDGARISGRCSVRIFGTHNGGLILFRRTVRSTNYGQQARFLTEFWAHEGHVWDWLNRVVYLPKSP